MPVVVVTGAAGFLGRRFTEELILRGYLVRGVDVRPGRGIIAGDISVPGAWTDTLRGADLVVHAAAIVTESGPRADFVRVNVTGTKTVLEQACAAGVRRVVHLSSKVVHGRSFADGIDETAPVQPTGNPYTDTKIAAEHVALRMIAEQAAPVTIIRPGDVYGPASPQWVIRPVEMMQRNLFTLLDGGRGVMALTYVDDLVDGVLAAAFADEAAGEIFNINGGTGVPAREYFTALAGLAGVHRPLRSLPSRPLEALTRPAELLSRATGKPLPYSPRVAEYLTHPGTYSIAKARNVLGWKPQVGLDEGLRRTADWLRTEGLVPSSR